MSKLQNDKYYNVNGDSTNDYASLPDREQQIKKELK